jgi:hypothetical protein
LTLARLEGASRFAVALVAGGGDGATPDQAYFSELPIRMAA